MNPKIRITKRNLDFVLTIDFDDGRCASALLTDKEMDKFVQGATTVYELDKKMFEMTTREA